MVVGAAVGTRLLGYHTRRLVRVQHAAARNDHGTQDGPVILAVQPDMGGLAAPMTHRPHGAPLRHRSEISSLRGHDASLVVIPGRIVLVGCGPARRHGWA